MVVVFFLFHYHKKKSHNLFLNFIVGFCFFWKTFFLHVVFFFSEICAWLRRKKDVKHVDPFKFDCCVKISVTLSEFFFPIWCFFFQDMRFWTQFVFFFPMGSFFFQARGFSEKKWCWIFLCCWLILTQHFIFKMKRAIWLWCICFKELQMVSDFLRRCQIF